MKRLLDIPLVMFLADWIWGEDPKVTPEFCVTNLPLMNGDCWSRAIVVGLGVAIILGACLNKAPVMMNIYRAQSTAGLSPTAVYGETLVYANCALYGLLNGHPFTAFGENAALFIQSILVTFMLWHYAVPPVATLQRLAMATMGLAYIFAVVWALPKAYDYILMRTVMPILLYSRGLQIYVTYTHQHTGAQSIATTGMNVMGGCVRILTTLKQVGLDWNILGTIVLSTMLNLTMLAQYFIYRDNTTRYLADLKAQGVKKEQ